MKVRMGFVTNSSSVSFTVWGINIEKSMLKKEILDKVEDGWINEELENLTGLKTDDIGGEGDLAIGADANVMDETKTLGQHKQDVVDALNKILSKPITVSDLEYIEHSYRDG